jgi:hypothetical protein
MAARRGRPDSYYESMASRCWDNACRKRAERYADARNATHVRKAIPLIQPSDPACTSPVDNSTAQNRWSAT